MDPSNITKTPATAPAVLPQPLDGTAIIPILSGGGTRFPAHVGVLQALGRLGVGFDRLVGLSGGSIVAALYAAGISLDEIAQWACETDFRDLVRFALPRLLFRGGMCSGRVFERWLDERLHGVTFGDLSLDLAVVATDIRLRRAVVFSKSTTPDLRVARAVRFSTGIPVLFDYQQYGEAVLVDGEILANEILLTETQRAESPAFTFEVEAAIRPPSPASRRFRLADYFSLLADTFTYATSTRRLGPWAWDHTVLIDVGAVPPVKLDLGPEEKRQFVRWGYETTLDILPTKLKGHYAHASGGGNSMPGGSLHGPNDATQPPCTPHSSGHGKVGKR